MNNFYLQNFTFYRILNKSEKSKFIRRIYYLSQIKELKISPKIKQNTQEIELLVFGAFAQITFGFRDYEMSRFTSIILTEKTFYSKLVNAEVKGLTIGNGYIFYSWEDFIKGYLFESDKINLALHELAHAIYVEKFHKKNKRVWMHWQKCAKQELEFLRENPSIKFFREYGKSNLSEFWAVCVECFFEDPISFQKNHLNLYTATAKVLRQDMAIRKLNQSMAA